MRWLAAILNMLDRLVPAPAPDLTVRRPHLSPVEYYQQAQRTRATAWQEVDR